MHKAWKHLTCYNNIFFCFFIFVVHIYHEVIVSSFDSVLLISSCSFKLSVCDSSVSSFHTFGDESSLCKCFELATVVLFPFHCFDVWVFLWRPCLVYTNQTLLIQRSTCLCVPPNIFPCFVFFPNLNQELASDD